MNNQMPYQFNPNQGYMPPFWGNNQNPDKHHELEKQLNRLERQVRQLENRVAKLEGSMNYPNNSSMYMM